MKILFVVHKYPPYSLGGTEIYTRNLATELARRGHEPVIYFRADIDKRPFAAQNEVLEGVRARRISAPLVNWRANPLVEFYRNFLNPTVERDFVNFLQQERPDIVHFQHVMGLSARLLPLTRALGYPTVLTLHDYWFICANAQLIWPDAQICRGKMGGLNCARCALARFKHPVFGLARPVIAPLFWYRDALVRQAALTAQRFIAPSRFLLDCYFKQGFPPERSVFVENGVDVAHLQSYPPVPAPDARMRFTYLGSLAWQKGVHVLVEAFQSIPPDKAHLTIYGSMDTFPDYVANLQRIANPANTTFAGSIPNSEVGRVLACSDAIVVPSVWYENSPVVIQEAFAAKVPVVASRLGALKEKIQDNENGLLFEPANPEVLFQILFGLILNPEKIRDLRDSIKLNLTVEQHVNTLLEIYAHPYLL